MQLLSGRGSIWTRLFLISKVLILTTKLCRAHNEVCPSREVVVKSRHFREVKGIIMLDQHSGFALLSTLHPQTGPSFQNCTYNVGITTIQIQEAKKKITRSPTVPRHKRFHSSVAICACPWSTVYTVVIIAMCQPQVLCFFCLKHFLPEVSVQDFKYHFLSAVSPSKSFF